MTHAIRILLIDDQTTIRQALQMLLEREPGFEIVGGAPDGESGIQAIEDLGPDIVLVDIEMPGINGIETARIINERYGTQVKVLMLTGQDDQSYLQQALQAGAKGYLLKTTPAEDLIYAIQAVKKGYSQVSPGLIEKLMAEATAIAGPVPIDGVTAETQRNGITSDSHGADRFLKCMQTLNEIDLHIKSLQPRIRPVLQQGETLKAYLKTIGFAEGF